MEWDPRVNDIFARAAEIESADECEAFLELACGQDKTLRAAVEGLLASHREVSSFMEQPAIHVDQMVDVDPRALEAGFAAPFVSDAAVVTGDAAHSVLRSIGKFIPRVPHVRLRSEDKEETPPSPDTRSKSGTRYQLEGEIARGGMGVIFKGRDADLGRDLAIKVLLDSHKDDPDVVARFVGEAQIGGQLQHPGIVPVHELGQLSDQRPFFSMKLVKGETLASLLANRTGPSDDLPRFLGIFEQICQTMAYAHSRGVIHRDLKPANIMVGAFGEVQVMDWGLAKVLGESSVADPLERESRQRPGDTVQTGRGSESDAPDASAPQTRMGSVMGTPAYMPPEQALGEVHRLDKRADVFGLGAILCEILTGQPPYVGQDGSEVYRRAAQARLDDCFSRLDTNSPEPQLTQLAKIALSPDPHNRMRDAGELSRGITEHLEGVQDRLKEAELARVEAHARSEEERRRKKLYLAIAGLMLVLALVGAVGAGLYKQLASEKSSLATRERQAKEQAQAETRRATVMRLTAQSQSIQEELPLQSVLLAMKAVELAQESSLWPMPIAHATLLRALSNIGGLPLANEPGRISEIPISASGRLIVTSNDSGIARIWEMTARVPIPLLDLHLPEGSHFGSIGVSSDGRTVIGASSVGRGTGKVRIWRLDSEGDSIVSIMDLPDYTSSASVAISQDGRLFATASDVGTRLWTLDAQDALASVVELGRHRGGWIKIQISPNKRWVVTVTDQLACLWDLKSANPVGSEQRFEQVAWRTSVAISRDSRWLAMGTDDGTRLLDLDSEDVAGSERWLPGTNVSISSDGHWLVTGGRDARLFDLKSTTPHAAVMAFSSKHYRP